MRIPTTLIIMDGYGLTAQDSGNAVSAAYTPVLDGLFATCPNTTLAASGQDVGLPAGQIGNSEVGHTNIGAGRIVYQDLTRITRDIASGGFFENKAYTEAMDAAKAGSASLHLLGLMSPGGVHSHIDHLWAFLEMARRRGLSAVYLHCFMDGRDTLPCSGKAVIEDILTKCGELGVGKIATMMGRFYAMDRDNRWDRVEAAYDAMVCGEGILDDDPLRAIQNSYDAGVTDEFIKPVVCDRTGLIKSGDSVIFLNFRPDRAREITRAFVDRDFNGFPRRNGYFPLRYVCTTQYDEKMPNVTVAYPSETITNTFGETISALGLTQLRAAETEKYAHVTFFFNGGTEAVSKGEDRLLVPSPKQFPTYDLIPEMSARELTREVVKRIESGIYDVIILNYANCDMVGHTGVFDAAVKAVEIVDECVGEVVNATAQMGGVSLVTADHGNAEDMIDSDGTTPQTAHTTNPVPLILVGADVTLRQGRLADIAPTILELMGLEKPDEMTGESLIVKR
ncbi:phosphoglycerate mutase [Sporobacter termitidis DSM 10068]|uniref:2,3-bisphosphoglycerate-independent phosphoglycerate mutase n=1 Tax=Sporobacter termitidis DSM 10068 TaxID=1123282 RepID=A0A1M5YW00_9FIRM|nr:2,3-bisphosphoglycerate-independent phosphoglycerate mutase [Sporobacter termitidis]SHI16044.1 phosphoglycerate mutase [Sporobacter termitidis DSM 10068]